MTVDGTSKGLPNQKRPFWQSFRSTLKVEFILMLMVATFLQCQRDSGALPYIGERQIINGDTQYYRIPEFSFIAQDSSMVTNQSLAGTPYVTDFFFTSCPTICPKVKQQMMRLQKTFNRSDQLQFLSMSIDYRKDSIPALRRYADKLGIDDAQWHLVQLKKDQIESVANQFFNIALEDPSAEGGFDHSGRLILVDGNGHVRAHCDGTDPSSVDAFAKDIKRLLHAG